MKGIKKGIAAFAFVSVLAVGLGGCGGQADGADENLLGIRPADPGRMIITITCSMELKNFVAAVEERFPDIRLVQDSYMGQFRNSEHVARVEHGDLGDIVMVKAGHIPKADLSEKLMDLSSREFPAAYNASALQADEDGHIRLIPGPLSFNCNMYNKTLFDENNWKLPESYEEFLALSQEIDRTGIRGFRNAYFDSGAQSYQIYQYCVISALDTLTQVDGQIWHNKFVAGEKVSLEPMENAFEDMRRLMDAGMIREGDLEVSMSMNLDAMAAREVAIGGGEIDHIRVLNESGKDEFRFMPHFSMTDGRGWLLNLGFYFGANRELQKKENQDKLNAVMDIMGFIASEEGQNILIEDGLGLVPATNGAKIPDNPALEQIRAQIESGRYIMRPGYEKFTSVLKTEIAAFIRGETDSRAILNKCGLIMERGVPPVTALGEAEADFTVLQTGCLKADVLRAAAGTDVALIGMAEADFYIPAGGTRTKLYRGPVTEDDIIRIAQFRLDAPFMCSRAEVSGETLMALLEYGATSEKEQSSGEVSHYHPLAVSGLRFTCHPGEAEGKRITDVRLEDGSRLQPDSMYTVSFIKGSFPEDKLSGTEIGITMTEALTDYIAAEKRVLPDTKRIRLK